jgi:dihydrofolate synthase / folylpolyglutamate synthase
MKVTAIKTNKIIPSRDNLYQVLDKYIKRLKNNSILVITSKIVAICEGRVVKNIGVNKMDLVKKEARYYLPPNNKYHISLTIKSNTLIPTAGIDESNANGYYILWPKNPQESANEIHAYLKKRFRLKNIGVLITDSKTTPLRMGTTGMAIAHSGFKALKNYINQKDIFGRKLRVTKASVIDGLAAAAVVVMGEGREQTPLATIEDVQFVEFQDRNPSRYELQDLRIELRDDLYATLLKSVKWNKGKD